MWIEVAFAQANALGRHFDKLIIIDIGNRLFERGEHYDNHQFEIAEAFAVRGLIEVALEASDLPAAIARAKAKVPVLATTDPKALIDWLNGYLAGVRT
jgi:UDP-N-acetylglucosamine transferase subunit ALG13